MVLRKLDYGEADRIYTLLTRDHGKVGAIARGVRRTSSKLAPALDVYGHVDLLLARGSGSLDVIAQAMRLPGPRLEAELNRTAHASLVTELAERVTEDRHLVEGIYELTVLALEELARETDPRRATAYYLMAALGLLGYAPELRECARCGNPLPEAGAAFSSAAGGFLCRDCAEPEMIRVSVAALKVLRLMGAGDIATYRRLRLEPVLLDEIETVLEGQLEYHLDHRLRSLQFLRQMRTTA